VIAGRAPVGALNLEAIGLRALSEFMAQSNDHG
jgi:hypothetical protein